MCSVTPLAHTKCLHLVHEVQETCAVGSGEGLTCLSLGACGDVMNALKAPYYSAPSLAVFKVQGLYFEREFHPS